MPGILKRTLAAIAMVAAFATTSAIAQQTGEARFAFVIANDLYQNEPLPTAANDAGLIADTLKSAGFDVTGARNLDQDTLRSSYREFLEKVTAAGPEAVAVIYFSGYGLQYNGDNYLVPAGAQIARDSEIPLNAIRLSDLTGPLAGLQAKVKVAIFDLAHPFSLARAPGLQLINPQPGMLIAMNAAPGMVGPVEKGPYGAYAQALAEMINTPGLPINDVFDQTRLRVAQLTKGAEVPWNVTRIDQPFEFFAAGPGTPPPAVTAAEIQARRTRPIRDFSVDEAYAAALERDTLQGYEQFLAAYPRSPYARTVRGLLAARREALIWRRTRDVGTPDAYWSYLRRYPRGPHATEAREILHELAAASEPPPDFRPIIYDVPPPPPDEEDYFDTPHPVFYDPDYAPPPVVVVFLPPPPRWWVLPPPPRIHRDNVYFLPEVEQREEPRWHHPPSYVIAPPRPHYENGERPGERAGHYVPIPAALAVGITSGRLLKGKALTPQKTNIPGKPRQGLPPMPPVTAPPPGQAHRGPTGHLPPSSLPGHPAAGLPPGGQPLPGVRGSRPPHELPGVGSPATGHTLPGAANLPHEHAPQAGHPVVGVPPTGHTLPGSHETNVPRELGNKPEHPALGVTPSGRVLPGASEANVPRHQGNEPQHPAVGLPPGGHSLPGVHEAHPPRPNAHVKPQTFLPPRTPHTTRLTQPPRVEHPSTMPPGVAPPRHYGASPPHAPPPFRTTAQPPRFQRPQPVHTAVSPPMQPRGFSQPMRQAVPQRHAGPPPQRPVGRADCGHPGRPCR